MTKKFVVLVVGLVLASAQVYASFPEDVDTQILNEAEKETDLELNVKAQTEEYKKIKELEVANTNIVYLRDESGRFRKPRTFLEQLTADTREVFGRSWNAGHVFGAIGAQNRFSAGTTLVAWKFVAVDGAVTYSPIESNRKADFEFQFPIRIERIPIGDGMELGDLFYRKDRVNGWYDHSVMRLLLSHSPTSGLFGFGFRISLEY